MTKFDGSNISMTWHETAVSPLLTQWIYCSLALSHRYITLLRSHGTKIADSAPNWAFRYSYSSFNSQMVMKWFTKVVPYCSQCYPLNYAVTPDRKLQILIRIDRFRTVTPVWIHRRIWNDAESLMQYRRGALLFCKVIRQISRSHGTEKIADFAPNWAFMDCIPNLNSQMAFKWCTTLDVV